MANAGKYTVRPMDPSWDMMSLLMGYNILVNGIHWGYNPLIPTSWDIQVRSAPASEFHGTPSLETSTCSHTIWKLSSRKKIPPFLTHNIHENGIFTDPRIPLISMVGKDTNCSSPMDQFVNIPLLPEPAAASRSWLIVGLVGV